MSSICPKCGTFMEGDICEKCQATEAAERYESTPKKKKSWTPIIVIFAIIIIIPLGIYLYFDHQIKVDERNEAEKAYEEIVEYYEDDNFYSALLDISRFNEEYYEEYNDLDKKVADLFARIEKDLYEKTKSSDDATVASACETYLEFYPNGKYESQVKVAQNKAAESLKYVDSITIDNGVAYYDMGLNKFISDYNKIIDNSDETDLVKAMMLLSTNPEYVTTTEGNHKAYNITPPVLASNRGTVKTTATVNADKTKILSINIFVPSITGSASVDISDQLANTVAVLANSSISSYEFQTMVKNLMSDGCAYSKGVFMGYYEDSSGSTIRVAALTEEAYNEIK